MFIFLYLGFGCFDICIGTVEIRPNLTESKPQLNPVFTFRINPGLTRVDRENKRRSIPLKVNATHHVEYTRGWNHIDLKNKSRVNPSKP